MHLLQHPASRHVQVETRKSIAPLSECGYFCGKVNLGSDLSQPANVKWIPKLCMTRSIQALSVNKMNCSLSAKRGVKCCIWLEQDEPIFEGELFCLTAPVCSSSSDSLVKFP